MLTLLESPDANNDNASGDFSFRSSFFSPQSVAHDAGEAAAAAAGAPLLMLPPSSGVRILTRHGPNPRQVLGFGSSLISGEN